MPFFYLFYGGVRPFTIIPRGPMQRPSETTIMSVNLRFGLADDGENAWQHRCQAFAPLFENCTPDFIGMQEANNFQTEYLTQTLPDYHVIGLRDPSPPTWQNNPIFYKKKWQCLKHTHYFLSDTPHMESKLPGSRWPRQCVIGLFKSEEKRLIVATTHFDFDSGVQMRSAELILKFLTEFPEEVPVILTGDFNASPGSPAHKLFEAHGFKDSFTGDHSSTFHGFTGEDLGGHIDWILYRGELRMTHARVVKEAFHGVYPSDHFPVLCRFQSRVP